ncbi:hypothetical protein VB005_04574 [Metarhizium brunneum]
MHQTTDIRGPHKRIPPDTTITSAVTARPQNSRRIQPGQHLHLVARRRVHSQRRPQDTRQARAGQVAALDSQRQRQLHHDGSNAGFSLGLVPKRPPTA